ncbi:hypothetical protein JX265_013535 [Neoarthrinium moseri]|uniref:Uncharacterized protein n=1 Tax=Neoarthrinium moseri TaxID=1658444 RepID=A0A9Q0AIN6_9PEZI|nr:hypothetical protein JX265_013535 [Neoarthrinium moseri]
MDVATLVKQMHDNLSEIHTTITGVSTESHHAQLDELEKKRNDLLDSLRAAFDQEKQELDSKRRTEREEIAEQRRKEDEEREARRRREDEEFQGRNDTEDLQRHEKLDENLKQVDEDTDQRMDEIEEAARRTVDQGRKRLDELEEKRREINRLIDEQLQMPLPSVPTRKRARGEKSVNGTKHGAPVSMPSPSKLEVGLLGNSDKTPETVPTPTVESGESSALVSDEVLKKDGQHEDVRTELRDSVAPEESQARTEAPEVTKSPSLAPHQDQADSQEEGVEGLEGRLAPQTEDSAIGLDPAVEADKTYSRHASLSGSESHSLDPIEESHPPKDEFEKEESGGIQVVTEIHQVPRSSVGPILTSESAGDTNEVLNSSWSNSSIGISDDEPLLLGTKAEPLRTDTSIQTSASGEAAMPSRAIRGSSDSPKGVELDTPKPNSIHSIPREEYDLAKGYAKEDTEDSTGAQCEFGSKDDSSDRPDEDAGNIRPNPGQPKAIEERLRTSNTASHEQDADDCDITPGSPTILNVGDGFEKSHDEAHDSALAWADIPQDNLSSPMKSRPETPTEAGTDTTRGLTTTPDTKQQNPPVELAESLPDSDSDVGGCEAYVVTGPGLYRGRNQDLGDHEPSQPVPTAVIEEQSANTGAIASDLDRINENTSLGSPPNDDDGGSAPGGDGESRGESTTAPERHSEPAGVPFREANHTHERESQGGNVVEDAGCDQGAVEVVHTAGKPVDSHSECAITEGTDIPISRPHYGDGQPRLPVEPGSGGLGLDRLEQPSGMGDVTEPNASDEGQYQHEVPEAVGEMACPGHDVDMVDDCDAEKARYMAGDLPSRNLDVDGSHDNLPVPDEDRDKFNPLLGKRIGKEAPEPAVTSPDDTRSSTCGSTDRQPFALSTSTDLPHSQSSPQETDDHLGMDNERRGHLVDFGTAEAESPSLGHDQVRSSNEPHPHMDDEPRPNEILGVKWGQEPAGEPEEPNECPASLAKQDPGNYLSQDNGVDRQQEANSNPAQRHGSLEETPVNSELHVEPSTKSHSESVISEQVNQGPLQMPGSAVGSLSSVVTQVVPTLMFGKVPKDEATSDQSTNEIYDDRTERLASDNTIDLGASEEAAGTTTMLVTDGNGDNHLSVDPPTRQTTSSPLPVENDTVHGHEDLFDDDNTSSYQDIETDQDDDSAAEIATHHTVSQQNTVHAARDSDGITDSLTSGEGIWKHGQDTVRPSNQSTDDQGTEYLSKGASKLGYPESHDIAKTPNIVPISHQSVPEISPLVLQSDTPTTPKRGGLAASRHAPWNSPQTPPHQTETNAESETSPAAFTPRDVTNVPWHERNDSIPQSLHSQSTLSSAPSSPVHSALPIDKHEPVIRDSWHGPLGNGMRSRAGTQLTDRNDTGDFDPFKYDSGSSFSYNANSPIRNVEMQQPQPQSSRSSLAGSPMFQKLRNMFEVPTGVESSSPPSRSASGNFQPVGRDRSSSLHKSFNLSDTDDSPRRAGFLNEHEDEVDEHSALLQSSNGFDRN